jgi:hypothetical protein
MSKVELFQIEVNRSLRRYLQQPGGELNVAFRDDDGQPMPYADALPGVFSQWLEIQSSWERRILIYREALDHMVSEHLLLWQWAERYLEARYPNEALQGLQNAGMPTEGQADYCATYAKALSILGRYNEAEAIARQGLTFDSTHKRCKIQLADALHLKGETEPAHRLYNEILYQNITQASLGSNDTLSFEQRVGFDGNVLHSPVYAINLLDHSPKVTQAMWQWAEDEFYWSPYFRCYHAYHLLDQGEGLRAFAKLLALIKEMPWVKEAALNTMALFEQLDPGGQKQLAATDRQWLANLISANNWSSKGMTNLGSKHFRLGSVNPKQ